MLGFGISTQSRKKFFFECFEAVVKFAPEDAVIVVCDDGSTDGTVLELNDWMEREGDRRVEIVAHPTIEGISATKNSLITAILAHQEVSDIFLIEDDVFPTKENWFDAFIKTAVEHSQAHLLFMPGVKKYGITYRTDEGEYPIAWKQWCSGMCMYFRRALLVEVERFETKFNRYGYDHNEITSRSLLAQWMSPVMYPHAVAVERESLLLSKDMEAEAKGQLIESSTTDQATKTRLAKMNESYYNQLLGKYRSKYEEVRFKPEQEKLLHRRHFYFKDYYPEFVLQDRSDILT